MNEIDIQKGKILRGNPKIEIVKSCMINDGIIKIETPSFFINKFKKSNSDFTFFIPASGSGSRMFQFLYDFLKNPNRSDSGSIELFVQKIEEFAFFNLLPQDVAESIEKHDFDISEIIDFIVQDEGLGFGNRPKGLIPFHNFGPFILNPVQEHVLQGVDLLSEAPKFHFTVSPQFQQDFINSIQSLEDLIGKKLDLELSVQDKATDSIVFDKDLVPLKNEDNDVFKRPSGHGALINNLNQINEDIIFVKNIDNVQHYSNARLSKEETGTISGVLVYIKEKIEKIIPLQDKDFLFELSKLNSKFSLFHDDCLENKSEDELRELLKRPLRVCGMVKNIGQPGGGPFWVKSKNGDLTKQIVEKSQIDLKSNQFKILSQSTHFNPVFMALSTKDGEGNKYDLSEYINSEEYFVVNKSQKGQDVQFVESPGLWNGGMYYWNTVFIELDPKVFTPVKTILDLLSPLHRGT